MPHCLQHLIDGEGTVRATQQIDWIVNGSDPRVAPSQGHGLRCRMHLCDDHAAKLVRETRDRYVITPIGSARRGVERSGEQQAWELDC